MSAPPFVPGPAVQHTHTGAATTAPNFTQRAADSANYPDASTILLAGLPDVWSERELLELLAP